MRIRAGVLACTITAGTVAASGQATPPQGPGQTFRSTTDVVMVDVSVRADGRAVTGLTPADFVLTDNGVRQQIETVEPSSVPIDVTLVMDVSGNQRRPWVPRQPPSKTVAALESEARQVTAILRPADRVRLLIADTYVQQVWPWQTAAEVTPIRAVTTAGLASLHDSLAAALMQPVEPARRHVVVARTKGLDTISTVTPDEVRAIAERSDAQFHLVMMEDVLIAERTLASFQCENMGFCWKTSRFWTPFMRPVLGGGDASGLTEDGLALAAAAAATNGGLHRTGVIMQPTLVATFRRAFEDFRSGYFLRYTPTGVPRTGWHKIEVRVPRSRSYAVVARTGYGIESVPVQPPSPPASAAGPRTLTELTRAYEQGNYQTVLTALRQSGEAPRLLQEFGKTGNPWPAMPRREAAFAIDLVEPSLFSPQRLVHTEAYAVLEKFARLVRHPLEPDEFERRWHEAVLTLLQGTVRPAITETFAERALARFPDEPQFLLARAIAADQQSAAFGPSPAAVIGPALSRPVAERIGQMYDGAIRWPQVAIEARIRKAWLLYRTGRLEEALALLDSSGAQANRDPTLRFLDHLFRGHVLVAWIGPTPRSRRIARRW